MLKTLDRYIIRQFLGTFFFILVLIMAIAVVFDISEKTEDFTESTATVIRVLFALCVPPFTHVSGASAISLSSTVHSASATGTEVPHDGHSCNPATGRPSSVIFHWH